MDPWLRIWDGHTQFVHLLRESDLGAGSCFQYPEVCSETVEDVPDHALIHGLLIAPPFVGALVDGDEDTYVRDRCIPALQMPCNGQAVVSCQNAPDLLDHHVGRRSAITAVLRYTSGNREGGEEERDGIGRAS